ncbi:MAG: hypothetical protein ACP5OH_02110 [Nitrososphaerota archaeon]
MKEYNEDATRAVLEHVRELGFCNISLNEMSAGTCHINIARLSIELKYKLVEP